MAVKRLTKQLIDAQEWTGRTVFIRDAKTPGLMLAINKRSKTFKVQADLWRRKKMVKSVRHTLGSVDDLTIAQARERAVEVLAGIKRGIDPNDPSVSLDPDAVANWTLSRLWDAYERDLIRRDRSPRTIADFRSYLTHLSDWLDLPLSSITKSLCQDKFEYITDNSGPVAANHVLGALSTAWRRAAEVRSDHTDSVVLQANPAATVRRHKVKARSNVIFPQDLPAWWAATQAIPNPMRGNMHQLGLLSGLRPTNLMGIEKEWIDLSGQAIHFPARVMKSREDFNLPLSRKMVGIVEAALEIGGIIHAGSDWLFPARGKLGLLQAASVITEKTMPGQTGHLLRRTYKTVALVAGVSDLKSALMLHHKIGSISDVYTSPAAMHDDLVEQQEVVSVAFEALITGA